MNKLGILVAGLAFAATSGVAATVDFEDEGLGASDLRNVGMEYLNGGIKFTSSENMRLVGVGGRTSGFVPDDTPVGDTFGKVFLTGDFNRNTDMALSFGTNLKSISFDIADIDGGSSDSILNQANDEVFTFTFLLSGSAVSSQVITSNDVAGDGVVVSVGYAGLFDKVEITGMTSGGSRNIGWGIDNIETTPVPLPAAGVMLITALGGIGLMRRRKRAS